MRYSRISPDRRSQGADSQKCVLNLSAAGRVRALIYESLSTTRVRFFSRLEHDGILRTPREVRHERNDVERLALPVAHA